MLAFIIQPVEDILVVDYTTLFRFHKKRQV